MMPRRILVSVLLAAGIGACSGSGPGGGIGPSTDDGALGESGGRFGDRIEDILGGGSIDRPPSRDGDRPAPLPGREPEPQPAPAPALVRYVATDGNDANPGTRELPWRTPGHAVAQAQPGMHILLRGGTYPPFTIGAVDGTAEEPIVLAAAKGSRPTIEGGPVLVRRAHWQLEGIEVRPGANAGVRFTGPGAHHGVLRDSVVRDGSAAYGVSVDLGATHITIENNEITNIWRGAGVDAHGIVIQPDSVGVRILGNEIHGNSGDSVQCIGPGQDAPNGQPARDLLIEGNLMYGDRENAVDIKWCEGVTIRGNVARGYRRSATSNGEAIVIHRGARNVVVERNDISEASRGIVTGVGANDITVRRNVIHQPVDEKVGILFGQGGNQVARHNTIIGAARGVQVLADAYGVTVRNNIFADVAQSLSGSATVERNLFHAAPTAGSGALSGDPMLDGEFFPRPGSPAIDAGLPGDGAAICGAGPDVGANERC
jgi:nitrous oxidase accessory protein NosD